MSGYGGPPAEQETVIVRLGAMPPPPAVYQLEVNYMVETACVYDSSVQIYYINGEGGASFLGDTGTINGFYA
jgi:hypothetical protein